MKLHRRLGNICGVLVFAAGSHWAIAPSVYAADPAAEGHKDVTVRGLVRQVDTERDQVVVTVRNGHRYILDTSQARITLPNTVRPAETGDLIPNMRITATGTLFQDNVLEADKVTVLGMYKKPVAAKPVHAALKPKASNKVVTTISLRGTVESVNQETGAFVVKIQNHRRTVFVDGDTDFHGVHVDPDQRLPFYPGDRIQVAGGVRKDQTVVADTVTLVARTHQPTPSAVALRQIVGRVTFVGDRVTSRDIRVKLGSDQEVTIHVPTGATVMRGNKGISMHELTPSDTVQIAAVPDGDAFRASRIDVIDTDVF